MKHEPELAPELIVFTGIALYGLLTNQSNKLAFTDPLLMADAAKVGEIGVNAAKIAKAAFAELQREDAAT